MKERMYDYNQDLGYQKGNYGVKQLANQVFVFCPSMKVGIMFYDQSPSGAVARLTGSLPEGKFWSSGEMPVNWNEEINGRKDELLLIDNNTSFLVEQKVINDKGGSSFVATTIIVSEDNFNELINQINNPTYASQENNGNYKVINLNSKIINIINVMSDSNKYEDKNYIIENDSNNFRK